MNFKKSKILKFTAVCFAAVLLSVTAILLMSAENALVRAQRNCDTITISAEYDSDINTLTATQSISYKNRSSNTLDSVKFHIYANAYRDGARYSPVSLADAPKAYPNGKNFGGISIQEVKANNKKTDVNIEGEDENVLSVPVSATLKPGESVNIELAYTVKLANVKHRLGYTDDAVNLGNFYPVPCIFEDGEWQTYPYSFNGDPFYNALHNFNVTLKCNNNLTVASSGGLVRSSAAGGKTSYEYKSSAIRDFAMVLSTKFQKLTRVVNKVALSYYYINDSEPAQSLKCAADALTTFSKIFTTYPYKQLSVVQTDFLHGGMEYGELVYISTDALVQTETTSSGTGNTSADRRDHNQVIIHEIAHQWWYGTVGNDQTCRAWIDEGLAEYSTLLFYDKNPEYNINRKELISNARDNYAAFVKIVNSVNGIVDPEMNKDLNSFQSSYEYVYMTYVRGMLLFADLETVVGTNQITNALKNFAGETQFSFATQNKLVESLERSTQTKLQVFFNSYLSGVSL